MEGLSDLLSTADELYGLLPESFTAARDERVRTLRRHGSRARALAVKELRRPSVAAWLVNAMVRHRRAELEQLLRLGEALREAQQSLDADQLRELNQQRRTVVAAIGREARTLARELGRPVSEQVAEEVEETLRAALADPVAASAVRSGRLTTSLRYAGFGDPEPVMTAAVPAPGRQRAAVAVAPASSAAPAMAPVPATTPAARAVALVGAGQPVPEELANPADLIGWPGGSGFPDAGGAVLRQDAAVREANLALQAAQEAARRAQGAALIAEQHRDSVLQRAGFARQRLDHAYARVAELESMLSSARDAAAAAAAGWAPLHAEADAAVARAETARGIADSARATLQSAQAHLAEVEQRGS